MNECAYFDLFNVVAKVRPCMLSQVIIKVGSIRTGFLWMDELFLILLHYDAINIIS
jgi:hypothetical protein